MNRRNHNLIIVSILAGLLTAPSRSDAGSFWDFLQNAWKGIQSQSYQDDQSSAESLENEIIASAAQSGVELASPDQYDGYARSLAKTLAALSPEQQARVLAVR
ncbi:MAG: hypothetical protein R3F19_11035 [Verrucomicrobiales bacterium]|nr:hypothetical protein [Verrucomicrobiae bacterium]